MIIGWIIFGLILIGMIIAGTAYSRTVRIIDKYDKMESKIGCTALQFAKVCSDSFDLDLQFVATDKKLQNAYVPKKKIVIIDSQMVNSKSVSAISVVAHEIGHAIQDENGNFLLKLDLVMKKIFRVLKFIVLPIIVAGIVLLFFKDWKIYGEILLLISVGIWIFSLVSRLVTIPMEYQASDIAYNILKDNRVFTRAELKATKKILNAAALTYVGALFINILNFFRLIKNSFKTN